MLGPPVSTRWTRSGVFVRLTGLAGCARDNRCANVNHLSSNLENIFKLQFNTEWLKLPFWRYIRRGALQINYYYQINWIAIYKFYTHILDDPCLNYGVCTPSNSPSCTCLPGFVGTRCEINVDNCPSSDCSVHGKLALATLWSANEANTKLFRLWNQISNKNKLLNIFNISYL